MNGTKNRNPVKQFFITFPKSGLVDKVIFRDSLLRFDPEYYKVSQETHADGTPHLHAVLKCKNKYSKSFVLKYFKEKYPDDYKRIDVEPVRSIKNAIQYISKEDSEPLESGEFKDPRNPQSSWLHKFVVELGYDNIDNLIRDTTALEEERSKYTKAIQKSFQDYLFVTGIKNPEEGVNIYLQHVNYEYSVIAKQLLGFDNRFLNYKHLKDDITFLFNQLKIKV